MSSLVTSGRVTPGRAKEIKRAAARHASWVLMDTLDESSSRRRAPEFDGTVAEETLLHEEIRRIAEELRHRGQAGGRGRCTGCDLDYHVKGDGTIRRHLGLTSAGLYTGELCPGADKPPSPA